MFIFAASEQPITLYRHGCLSSERSSRLLDGAASSIVVLLPGQSEPVPVFVETLKDALSPSSSHEGDSCYHLYGGVVVP